MPEKDFVRIRIMPRAAPARTLVESMFSGWTNKYWIAALIGFISWQTVSLNCVPRRDMQDLLIKPAMNMKCWSAM